MKLENKNYDVVNKNGSLLCRGFASLFFGNNVQIQKLGPFGSGMAVVDASQLRPFNSVEDTSDNKFARTAIW
jgi:hypothetical protein